MPVAGYGSFPIPPKLLRSWLGKTDHRPLVTDPCSFILKGFLMKSLTTFFYFLFFLFQPILHSYKRKTRLQARFLWIFSTGLKEGGVEVRYPNPCLTAHRLTRIYFLFKPFAERPWLLLFV